MFVVFSVLADQWTCECVCYRVVFFFSSRRRHTRSSTVSWARRCVKRQLHGCVDVLVAGGELELAAAPLLRHLLQPGEQRISCLLYTSDAADERSSVDLGGRRIIQTTTQ